MAHGSVDSLVTWTERRWAWIVLFSVFLVTRIAIVVIASLVEGSSLDLEADAWDHRPILGSLTSFDSVYLLGIAEDGYHLDPVRENHLDWVFFPGYPIVVRAATVMTGGDAAVAGVAVSNVAFLAAMAVLYELSRRYMDSATSVRAIAYLAIAPGAAAFAMAYSDSLFLLLAAGTFLFAERGRGLMMAALLAGATLTRLPGITLIVPLAFLLARRPATPRRMFLFLAAGPLALGLFAIYQGQLLGDPLGFISAQASWNFGETGSETPGDGSSILVTFDPVPLLLTTVLVGHIFLLVYARVDKIPLPYVVLAVCMLLVVAGSLRLLSVQRYLVVAWPFDWILAHRRAPVFRIGWPILSFAIFSLFTALHFSGILAP